jgi:protein subunit release factor A
VLYVLSRRYQRYLESVLEVADEYQEVQDLLLRHATLQATNDDLRAHQQRCSKEAEDIRTALQAFVKQQTDELLDLNNTLAKLKKQLEQQEEQAGVLVSRAGSGGAVRRSAPSRGHIGIAGASQQYGQTRVHSCHKRMVTFTDCDSKGV